MQYGTIFISTRLGSILCIYIAFWQHMVIQTELLYPVLSQDRTYLLYISAYAVACYILYCQAYKKDKSEGIHSMDRKLITEIYGVYTVNSRFLKLLLYSNHPDTLNRPWGPMQQNPYVLQHWKYLIFLKTSVPGFLHPMAIIFTVWLAYWIQLKGSWRNYTLHATLLSAWHMLWQPMQVLTSKGVHYCSL